MIDVQPALAEPNFSQVPQFVAGPDVGYGQPQERDTAMLVMYYNEHERRCWPLNRAKPFTIGRSPHCDIVLDDRQVSRYHARISWHNDCYYVEDLGSKNGTEVNGEKRLVPAALHDGDEFLVGIEHRLLFVDDGATAPLTIMPNLRGLTIDEDTRSVYVNQVVLDPPLSLPQYQLLMKLWNNQGKIVSRDDIVDAVWPDESFEGISEQAIDALVRRLRERIGEVDPDGHYVVTVRGHGFRLENGSG